MKNLNMNLAAGKIQRLRSTVFSSEFNSDIYLLPG